MTAQGKIISVSLVLFVGSDKITYLPKIDLKLHNCQKINIHVIENIQSNLY